MDQASDSKYGKIQHDISWIYTKISFPKNKNTADFDNLDDSEVISNDFFGYKNLCSHIGPISCYAMVANTRFCFLM